MNFSMRDERENATGYVLEKQRYRDNPVITVILAHFTL